MTAKTTVHPLCLSAVGGLAGDDLLLFGLASCRDCRVSPQSQVAGKSILLPAISLWTRLCGSPATTHRRVRPRAEILPTVKNGWRRVLPAALSSEARTFLVYAFFKANRDRPTCQKIHSHSLPYKGNTFNPCGVVLQFYGN